MNSTVQPPGLFRVGDDPEQEAAYGRRLFGVAVGLVLFGAVIRIARYLWAPTLWNDEAALARNLLERNFFELALPLDYGQCAPIGFLWSVKSLMLLLGNNDYAVRLLPLAAGIGALVLWWCFAQRVWGSRVALIGLIWLAVGRDAIRYSVELKPYSLDLLLCLAVLWVSWSGHINGWNRARLVGFGLLATVGVWFSFPLAFVLAGVGGLLVLVEIVGRRLQTAFFLALANALAALSFVVHFKLLGSNTRAPNFQSFWDAHFMPWPPTTLADWMWIPTTLVDVFSEPMRVGYPLLGVVLALLGLVALVRRNPGLAIALMLPVCVHVAVSALRLYPFQGRMILYTLPIWLSFVALGIVVVGQSTRRLGPAVAVGMLLILAAEFYPRFTLEAVLAPPFKEELQPCMEFMRDHSQPDDQVILAFNSAYAYHWYAARYAVGHLTKQEDLQLQPRELSGRCWLVCSHGYDTTFAREIAAFVDHARDQGFKVTWYDPTGTAAAILLEPPGSDRVASSPTTTR